MSISRRLGLAGLLLGALGLMALPTQAAPTVTLLYYGNLDGELEPCGCSAGGDYGGIARQATIIDAAREADPQTVVISTGGLLSPNLAVDTIRNRFILTGTEALALDAVGTQWSDLSHGEAFIAETALPWTTTNWRDETFNTSQVIQRTAADIEFFQWLDPNHSPYRDLPPPLRRVKTDMTILTAALVRARQKGHLTLLGTTLPAETARRLLPLSYIDILFIKSRYEFFGAPQQWGDTLVLQPGSRGQRMGKVILTLGDNGISGWDHSVIELPVSVTEAPRMAQWYENYNAAEKADYLKRVEQRKAIDSGKSDYVGAATCQQCHAIQYEQWQSTDHAGALQKLKQVGKAFDAHCLECHTVGFMQEGGFLDELMSKHLADVQCENCHGPGRAHSEAPTTTPTTNRGREPESLCRQCHIHDHSPAFQFDTYWPRIQHSNVSN